jgi:hypothetical protein
LVVSEQQPITSVQEALVRLCAILTLTLLSFLAAPAPATTYVVDVGGSGDYTTIWDAMSVAAEGDTILVLPGTYTGVDNTNINPLGMNLVFLAFDDGRAPVVIDGGGVAIAFYFHNGEDATTLVRGFTIQQAENATHGGAITISNSSPKIENCTFLDNHTATRGGAIHLSGSSSSVTACIFRGNSAQSLGGAIASYNGSSTVITGCLFDENTVHPEGSGGGALYCDGGSETITLCTVVENGPDQIAIDGDYGVTISNCIIAFATDGVGVAASYPNNATVTHCVLFGNAGGDTPECDHFENIYHDPLFCDDLVDDYTLCDDSFAVDYNNMWYEQIGAYESGCPPCDTAVEPTSWGVMKALFR